MAMALQRRRLHPRAGKQEGLAAAGSDDFLRGNIRVSKDLDGLGCLGDLGWYCIRAALWAYDYELPRSVQAAPGQSCSSFFGDHQQRFGDLPGISPILNFINAP
jgi:hypothetical protein